MELNTIRDCATKTNRPIKVLQFGEGNFLRGFATYMIDILNEKTDFNGNVVIVKPIAYGSLDDFHAQDCIYTVLLRGFLNGKETRVQRIVTSVDSALSCTDDYAAYDALAKLDTLQFVISNTTEAGIVLMEEDAFDACPPASYPGKLTKFLYNRYTHFQGDKTKGLTILPVELIDDNGIHLERIVKRLAEIWKLPHAFVQWLNDACVFTSTLVDRIITGYPASEAKALEETFGYTDNLMVTGEPFALWVIESKTDLRAALPFEQAGLPVIFTDNQKPYKQRKVRILNGAHTSFVPAAYLYGCDFVGEAMDNETVRTFMNQTIFDEVIPTLDLPKGDLESFANAVLDRFKNPYIKHALLSITLNCVSKWRARCLPSLLAYQTAKGRLPKHLTFSLAAMIAFYAGAEQQNDGVFAKRGQEPYELKDDKDVLDFFVQNKQLSTAELVQSFLSNERFFGMDLTTVADLLTEVTSYVADIRNNGMKAALEKNCNSYYN